MGWLPVVISSLPPGIIRCWPPCQCSKVYVGEMHSRLETQVKEHRLGMHTTKGTRRSLPSLSISGTSNIKWTGMKLGCWTEPPNLGIMTLIVGNFTVTYLGVIAYNILDPTCNTYSDLIGWIEVSILHKKKTCMLHNKPYKLHKKKTW